MKIQLMSSLVSWRTELSAVIHPNPPPSPNFTGGRKMYESRREERERKKDREREGERERVRVWHIVSTVMYKH